MISYVVQKKQGQYTFAAIVHTTVVAHDDEDYLPALSNISLPTYPYISLLVIQVQVF